MSDLNVYLGNNQLKNSASLMTKFRDLRVWGEQRTFAQINSWKHRQLNTFEYSSTQLLTYFRLSEGDYEFYNYVSSMNPNVSQHIWAVDIDYSQDSYVLVCPQQTYYYE